MTRRLAYSLIAAACVLPRAAALLHERNAILTSFTEKSDDIARVFLDSGTFGYIPGEPTAYTQPLYGWFLIAVYWVAGRHWWSIGTVQIAVALATALLVYETGRRFLSPRAGLLAAVIATLQPYLVWHDVHVNREIIDQLLGVSIFGLALVTAERRTPPLAAALGLVSGLAILSNARLLLLPLALAAYLLWRGAGWGAVACVPVVAALALTPWIVRNKVQVGCFALTTDARALWKANNPATYGILDSGQWIDSVPDPPGVPLTPQTARDFYLADGIKPHIDECAQQSYYQHLVWSFWEHHPGEKVKLAAQATRLLWDPRVGLDAGGAGDTGTLHHLRVWVEPLFVVPLYILAVAGLFLVGWGFRALALIFVGYETLAAWVFAGTTRYRVSWDFVLALLAAAALTRLPLWRSASQKR